MLGKLLHKVDPGCECDRIVLVALCAIYAWNDMKHTGLERFLDKIKSDPTNEILRNRLLILLEELDGSQCEVKLNFIRRLGKIFVGIDYRLALKFAYRSYFEAEALGPRKSHSMRLRAMAVLIDSFVAAGMGAKAEILRVELERMRNEFEPGTSVERVSQLMQHYNQKSELMALQGPSDEGGLAHPKVSIAQEPKVKPAELGDGNGSELATVYEPAFQMEKSPQTGGDQANKVVALVGRNDEDSNKIDDSVSNDLSRQEGDDVDHTVVMSSADESQLNETTEVSQPLSLLSDEEIAGESGLKIMTKDNFPQSQYLGEQSTSQPELHNDPERQPSKREQQEAALVVALCEHYCQHEMLGECDALVRTLAPQVYRLVQPKWQQLRQQIQDDGAKFGQVGHCAVEDPLSEPFWSLFTTHVQALDPSKGVLARVPDKQVKKRFLTLVDKLVSQPSLAGKRVVTYLAWEFLQPTLCLDLLEQAELSNEALAFYEFYLDILLANGKAQWALRSIGEVVQFNQDATWAFSLYQKIPRVWQMLQVRGFRWAWSDGVDAFLDRLFCREIPSLTISPT